MRKDGLIYMATKAELQSEINRVESIISLLKIRQQDSNDFTSRGIPGYGQNYSGTIQQHEIYLSQLRNALQEANEEEQRIYVKKQEMDKLREQTDPIYRQRKEKERQLEQQRINEKKQAQKKLEEKNYMIAIKNLQNLNGMVASYKAKPSNEISALIKAFNTLINQFRSIDYSDSYNKAIQCEKIKKVLEADYKKKMLAQGKCPVCKVNIKIISTLQNFLDNKSQCGSCGRTY